MPGKWWIAIGALMMSLGVIAGAIGTHILRDRMARPPVDILAFQTAAEYHMFHALALVALGVLAGRVQSRWLTAIGIAILAGIFLFSGGIYAHTLSLNPRWIRIVPTGGMTWIIAWIVFAVWAASLRKREVDL